MEPPLPANHTNLTTLVPNPIPLTQTTAPVHHFRCLYTFDLRRKAKRWQDGALRFHTFNKRIMVYDISRNFIGDTHWRDGGTIEDGDELELDKGVLIQVGEKTESVEQDLRALFEKKGRGRRNQGGFGSGEVDDDDNDISLVLLPDPAPPRQTGMSAPSQLRPKSLNAILGTPSGSLGRAALQMKSPCELRLQKGHETGGVQRGAKRRRIDDESLSKSTSPSSPSSKLSSVSTQDPRIAMPQPPRPRTAATAPTRERNAESGMGKAAAAANKKDLGRRGLSFSAQGTHTKKRIQTAPTMMTEGIIPTKLSLTSINRISTDNVTDETPRSTVPCPNSTHPPENSPTVSEKPPGRIPSSTGILLSHSPQDLQKPHDAPQPPKQQQQQQLQITSRKPARKKLLIYQNLLLPPSIIAPTSFLPPPPPQESARGENNGSVVVKSSRKRRSSGEEKKRDREIQAEFHQAQKGRLESRLRRHGRREEEKKKKKKKKKSSSSRQQDGDGVENEDLVTISDDGEDEEGENDLLSSARHRDSLQNRQTTEDRERPAADIPPPLGLFNLPKEHALLHTNPPFLQRSSSRETPTLTSDLELAQMDQILLTRPSPPKLSNVFLPPHKTSKFSPNDEPEELFISSPPAPPPPIIPSTSSTHLHEPPSLIPPDVPPNPFSNLPPPPPPPPPPSPPSKSKPHKKRSPMRKTVSEPLRTPATRGLALPGAPVAAAPPLLAEKVENQAPDPWSREAWDLFGFGRPGDGGGGGGGGGGGMKGK